MESQSHQVAGVWLINKLEANHTPINVNNKSVHRMEELPVAASSAGLVTESAYGIGPQVGRWSV